MSANTPGPWTVAECHHGGGLLKRGDQTGPRTHVQSSLQILPMEDARLIAAAPELLQSAKELYQILLDGMQGDYDAMIESLGNARRAIAKAEGR